MGGRSREVKKIVIGSPPPKPNTNYLSNDNRFTFVGKGGQILEQTTPKELADRIRSIAADGIM
jgi:hypothetical protein